MPRRNRRPSRRRGLPVATTGDPLADLTESQRLDYYARELVNEGRAAPLILGPMQYAYRRPGEDQGAQELQRSGSVTPHLKRKPPSELRPSRSVTERHDQPPL